MREELHYLVGPDAWHWDARDPYAPGWWSKGKIK